MKPLSWITKVSLALSLQLMGTSWATQESAVLVKDGARPNKQPAETLTSMEPDASTKAKVQAVYGKLPLQFETNQGQTDAQVKFLSRGRGYTLFLTPSEAVLALRKPVRLTTGDDGDEQAATEALLRMKLVGANNEPQMVGLEKLSGKVNYFIGNDAKRWRTSIPTYAKVKYQAVYPGIDLIYYGNQRRLHRGPNPLHQLPHSQSLATRFGRWERRLCSEI